MSNFLTMCFRFSITAIVLVFASSCLFQNETEKDIDPAQVEEQLYQISLKSHIPGASEEFKEIRKIILKVTYGREKIERLKDRLNNLDKDKKEVINFDPPGPHPTLLHGVLNTMSSNAPSDSPLKLESQRSIVKLLLASGANPNLKQSPFQQTALHQAISLREIELCKEMIRYGANPHFKDVNGRTSLELAYADESSSAIDQKIYQLIKKAAEKK